MGRDASKNTMSKALAPSAMDLHDPSHALPVFAREDIPHVVRRLFSLSTLDLITPGRAAQEIFREHDYAWVMRHIQGKDIRSYKIDGVVFLSRADCMRFLEEGRARKLGTLRKSKAWERRKMREGKCPMCGMKLTEHKRQKMEEREERRKRLMEEMPEGAIRE